jgi:hypothetical protein
VAADVNHVAMKSNRGRVWTLGNMSKRRETGEIRRV